VTGRGPKTKFSFTHSLRMGVVKAHHVLARSFTLHIVRPIATMLTVKSSTIACR